MSPRSLHTVRREEEEEEEEELWRMEMDRNRREVRSPYFVPILRLKPCWQAWTRNLNEIVLSHARQAAVAQQHTAELSGVLKTQDRMESSIHGSAGGSPNPDLWTSSPEVTSFPDVAPSAACCPLSNPITVSIRSIADYTRCSLEQTILPHLRVEPPLTMRRSLRLQEKPVPTADSWEAVEINLVQLWWEPCGRKLTKHYRRWGRI